MNLKLEPLYLGLLTHVEFSGLIDRQLSCLNSLREEVVFDALLTQYINRMEALYQQLFNGLNPTRTSIDTSNVVSANHEQRHALSAFKAAVQLFSLSNDACEKESARILKMALKQYKLIERKQCGVISELLGSLLFQLSEAPMKESVEHLQLQRYINRMHLAKEAFDEVYLRRGLARDLAPRINNRQARAQLAEVYCDMTAFVLAQSKVDAPGYVRVLSLINTLRAEMALVLARRRGVKAAQKKRDNAVLVEFSNQ